MEIEIYKAKADFQFYSKNNSVEIPVCASDILEFGNSGFRPMELLLTGLGSCLSIDVLNILYKQRQTVSDYRVKVSATRSTEIPSIFENISLSIELSGEIHEEKLKKAIQLAEEKYCSVYKILAKSSTITIQYQLNNVQ